MKKILFIIGSLRKESFNKKLAKEVEEMLDGRATVEYLDYSDVPLMKQDIEFPAPEPVKRVRGKVAEADALWIFSPEYNYSYPGHLKNLIDWLSRPLVAGDRQTPLAINGKKVALSGAGGASATAKCREKLTELLTLPFIHAEVMTEPQTGIQLNMEAWTEGRMILTEAQRSSLKRQVDAFIDYISDLHITKKETTNISDLFQVLDLLDNMKIQYWLDGGWGVDALYGKQTRTHRDIDIDFDAQYHDELLTLLQKKGYLIETDCYPNRIELHSEKLGYIDIHPFVLNSDGTSKQADLNGGWYEFQPDFFGTAVLEGRTIPCISLKAQKVFHTGYELRDKDIHDLAILERI